MIDVSLDKIIDALRQAKIDFTAEDLADALWLAPRLPLRMEMLESIEQESKPVTPTQPPLDLPKTDPPSSSTKNTPDTHGSTASQQGFDAYLPTIGSGASAHGVKVELPDTAALPNALAIARDATFSQTTRNDSCLTPG